jgi:hypothetical protein
MSGENVGVLVTMRGMTLPSYAHQDQERYDPSGDEAAEADAIMREYREWVAAGRPGAVSHAEAMALLLGSDGLLGSTA